MRTLPCVTPNMQKKHILSRERSSSGTVSPSTAINSLSLNMLSYNVFDEILETLESSVTSLPFTVQRFVFTVLRRNMCCSKLILFRSPFTFVFFVVILSRSSLRKSLDFWSAISNLRKKLI